VCVSADGRDHARRCIRTCTRDRSLWRNGVVANARRGRAASVNDRSRRPFVGCSCFVCAWGGVGGVGGWLGGCSFLRAPAMRLKSAYVHVTRVFECQFEFAPSVLYSNSAVHVRLLYICHVDRVGRRVRHRYIYRYISIDIATLKF
jgi:hypothetical protein